MTDIMALVLNTSIVAGIFTGMGEMKKITVEVPEDLLASAQDYTGEGVTETVRRALQKLTAIRAQQDARKLRGKVRFSMTWQDLKHDRE